MGRVIKSVGVVGLGMIGAGIVEVFARSGYAVVGVEKDDAALERGKAAVERSTQRAVEGSSKMTAEDRVALLGRVTYGVGLEPLKDCDYIIEAIPEDLELKKDLFQRLDQIVKEEAILSTTTSALSVTDIASATGHPRRVMGLHFFIPAPQKQFVEMVSTVMLDAEVLDTVKGLADSLGVSYVVAGDRAGFISNGLLMAYLNHAISFYENKYASREDIDAAMRYGCGMPMGPLATADLIGLDTVYSVLDTMYHESRDRLHAPMPILKQLISAGLLGRKTGRGFYTYEAPGSSKIVPDSETPQANMDGEGLRPIEKVGVIGNGTMAMGIVEVFVKAGYDTTFVARSQEKADASLAKMAKGFEKMIAKGRFTEEKRDAALALAHPTDNYDDLKDVDIVVEAIAEDLAVKKSTFEKLDAVCKPGCILATTTSSLPIIQIATVTSRPADVIGMHFFNPAQVMKLVEVVTTVATAADVNDTVRALCKKVGKVDVGCGDRSGFIVNALLFPYLNDAAKMLEAHYATADEIDAVMTGGCGYPMGPFALLDVVGLDVSLAIQKELYTEFRDRGFAPAPLMEHLVKAGYLGRKAGRGFRTY